MEKDAHATGEQAPRSDEPVDGVALGYGEAALLCMLLRFIQADKTAYLSCLGVESHLAVFKQRCLQALSGPSKPGFDGGQRQLMGTRIFGLFVAFQIACRQHLPFACSEFFQSTWQTNRQQIDRQGFLLVSGEIGREFKVFAAQTKMIYELVARRREQPGAGIVERAEARLTA